MKPASFDYARCERVEDALGILAEHGDEARIMAGGQSLMPMLNMRLVRPAIVVDIGRLRSLASITEGKGYVEFGATVTQVAAEEWPKLEAQLPLVAKVIPNIGHFQTRNRGTICGSLCHADPSSELPLCLATLGGEVVLRSRRKQRVVKADDFQLGLLSTAKQPDEMMVAARFPIARSGWGYAFREVSRRHGDFAIVALAAAVGDGKIRLGIGGVADRPEVAEWDEMDDDGLADALNEFAWQLGGSDDIHATARYRREMVRRLGFKLIQEARQCRS
ncbi:MAG: FAD binding domain-containing protein [Pseudolabrys sp.]